MKNKKLYTKSGLTLFYTAVFAVSFLFVTYLTYSYNLYRAIEIHRLNLERYTDSTYIADSLFDNLPKIKLNEDKFKLFISTKEKSISFPNFFVRANFTYSKTLGFNINNVVNEYRTLFNFGDINTIDIESENLKIFFNHSKLDSMNLVYKESQNVKNNTIDSSVNLVGDKSFISIDISGSRETDKIDLLGEIISTASKDKTKEEVKIECKIKEKATCINLH